MRTTTWQIVRLAWALWRSKHRRSQRIGQLIYNVSPVFYVENDNLIRAIERWR